MSRKFVRDRLTVELRDYAPGFHWAEEFTTILRSCDHLELKIRKVNDSPEAKADADGPCRADLQVMAISPENLANGIAALMALRQADLNTPILALTDEQAAKPLLRLMEAGASDLLGLPWCRAEILARLTRWVPRRQEIATTVKSSTREIGLTLVIGKSVSIMDQLQKAQRYALCDAAVMITGETGTGKEVFARAIHYYGPRRKQPFIAINCAALPTELVENELFGHQAGAFTDAGRCQEGLIAQAESGTLFLDEIESLPNAVQAKLLRFLQEGEYRPLGSGPSRQTDVRVIGASNSDLIALIQKGMFRKDLYFRLNVLPLNLSPLRQRREDIPLLASHLIERHASALGRGQVTLSTQAIEKLMSYAWPGNVRELENIIQQALIASAGPIIQAASVEMPDTLLSGAGPSFREQKARAVKEFERGYLTQVLAQSKGNVSHAARAARKDRRSFSKLLRKHDIRFVEGEPYPHSPSLQTALAASNRATA